MSDKIEKEIMIDAPVSVVWDVITKPEHIGKWLSNSAELELKAGGKGSFKWDKLGEAPLEVVVVDEPYLFSFLWVAPDEETRRNNGQTLVEFRLSKDGESTKLHLTESGFDQLDLTENEKASLYARHNDNGWSSILNNLRDYADTYEKNDN